MCNTRNDAWVPSHRNTLLFFGEQLLLAPGKKSIKWVQQGFAAAFTLRGGEEKEKKKFSFFITTCCVCDSDTHTTRVSIVVFLSPFFRDTVCFNILYCASSSLSYFGFVAISPERWACSVPLKPRILFFFLKVSDRVEGKRCTQYTVYSRLFVVKRN